MSQLLDPLLIVALALNFVALGVSRIRGVIHAVATVWTGFLLLTTRRKAIMQVLGYLLLENGIFMFGLLLLEAIPFLVEIGVLLDLFTAVFVMGIIINHLQAGGNPCCGLAPVLLFIKTDKGVVAAVSTCVT